MLQKILNFLKTPLRHIFNMENTSKVFQNTTIFFHTLFRKLLTRKGIILGSSVVAVIIIATISIHFLYKSTFQASPNPVNSNIDNNYFVSDDVTIAADGTVPDIPLNQMAIDKMRYAQDQGKTFWLGFKDSQENSGKVYAMHDVKVFLNNGVELPVGFKDDRLGGPDNSWYPIDYPSTGSRNGPAITTSSTVVLGYYSYMGNYQTRRSAVAYNFKNINNTIDSAVLKIGGANYYGENSPSGGRTFRVVVFTSDYEPKQINSTMYSVKESDFSRIYHAMDNPVTGPIYITIHTMPYPKYFSSDYSVTNEALDLITIEDKTSKSLKVYSNGNTATLIAGHEYKFYSAKACVDSDKAAEGVLAIKCEFSHMALITDRIIDKNLALNILDDPVANASSIGSSNSMYDIGIGNKYTFGADVNADPEVFYSNSDDPIFANFKGSGDLYFYYKPNVSENVTFEETGSGESYAETSAGVYKRTNSFWLRWQSRYYNTIKIKGVGLAGQVMKSVEVYRNSALIATYSPSDFEIFQQGATERYMIIPTAIAVKAQKIKIYYGAPAASDYDRKPNTDIQVEAIAPGLGTYSNDDVIVSGKIIEFKGNTPDQIQFHLYKKNDTAKTDVIANVLTGTYIKNTMYLGIKDIYKGKLAPNTDYLFTFCAKNTKGENCSAPVAFKTNPTLIRVVKEPTVTTIKAENPTADSIDLYGTMTSHGTAVATAIGFKYWPKGDASNFKTQNPTRDYSGTPTPFDYHALSISGLSASTIYVYQAIGVSADGTGYGAEKEFATSAAPPPAPGYRRVKINNNGGGTVTGVKDYIQNSNVTVTAAPSLNYDFVSWTDGTRVLSTDKNYNFKLLDDTTLTANFSLTPPPPPPTAEPVVFTLSAQASNSESGTLVGKIDNNGGSNIREYGFEYGINTASTSKIIGARIDTVGNYVTILNSLQASTTYQIRAYAINVNGKTGYGNWISFTTQKVKPVVNIEYWSSTNFANIGGTQPTGPRSATQIEPNEGDNVSVPISVNSTEQIKLIYDNGTSIALPAGTGKALNGPTSFAHSIPAIDRAHDIKVVFDPKRFWITAGYDSAKGSVLVNSIAVDRSVDIGSSLNINITPNANYKLDKVLDNTVDVTASVVNNTYTIPNIQADHSISVSFAPVPLVNVTVAPDPAGYAFPARRAVPKGSNAMFEISANLNYRIDSISDGTNTISPQNEVEKIGYQYNVPNVMVDKTITVSYVQMNSSEALQLYSTAIQDRIEDIFSTANTVARKIIQDIRNFWGLN